LEKGFGGEIGKLFGFQSFTSNSPSSGVKRRKSLKKTNTLLQLSQRVEYETKESKHAISKLYNVLMVQFLNHVKETAAKPPKDILDKKDPDINELCALIKGTDVFLDVESSQQEEEQDSAS